MVKGALAGGSSKRLLLNSHWLSTSTAPLTQLQACMHSLIGRIRELRDRECGVSPFRTADSCSFTISTAHRFILERERTHRKTCFICKDSAAKWRVHAYPTCANGYLPDQKAGQ